MDRKNAVQIIKKIFEVCAFSEGKSIAIMPMNAGAILSQGCQIYFKVDDSEILESCLTRIAMDNHLAVKQLGAFWVLYKSKQDNEPLKRSISSKMST